MSSSVFKVYPPSPTTSREEAGALNAKGESSGVETSGETEASQVSTADERLKIDSNLVIVVGKDGSVHVDQKTLHSLLVNEANDTSVSVVRITSPTPSIEAEIEEERRLVREQKFELELETGTGSSDSGAGDIPDIPPGGGSKNETPGSTTTSGITTRRGNKPTTDKKEDVILDDIDTPHVSMMVEGFYPPGEAKKFAEEVLTLAGLRKPLRVETKVDYEFQRYVIANDHCYTPLTSPSQKLPPRSFYEDLDSPIDVRTGDAATTSETQATSNQNPQGESTSSRKRSISKATPVTPINKSRRRKSTKEINDAEDLQSILAGSDSDYTEESSDPVEDDNDSDLDFSITGRTPKKRKSSSHHNKISKRKEDSHDSVKKRISKTPKKPEPKTPVSMLNKTGVPRTYGSKRNLQPLHVSGSASTTSVSISTAGNTDIVPNPAPVSVTSVKKDNKKIHKPAHHVEALFSDMTSLFSTPDIIKKVGTSRHGQSVGTPTTSTVIAPSNSNTVRGFVQLSPATLRGPQKLPAHISIQTHTSASEEHDKRLDLIDSIVQQELNHPDPKLPLQQPTMTEDIVKMLENNLPPGGVQGPVLPITDNSILAALGSNDDGLPEDLLQHVAELAEHKELQEILDNQVLGVIGTDNAMQSASSIHNSSISINPISIAQQMQPTVIHGTPSSSSTNSELLPTMTVKEQLMPRKEAIQIRRSDGRVITLPPIEAPATRSAKRRAQAGSSSSASTSMVSIASHTTTAPSGGSTPSPTVQNLKYARQIARISTGAVSYDDGSGSLMIDESRSKGSRSGTSSRRTSESSSTSGRGKRQSTDAAAASAANIIEDDAESDKSWNSEDDPDRLWCICMQPHNNRFMICCDTCEEWFHGKCVNVTKAMGQQMEKEGVEWSCPNCTKKKQEKQQPKMTEYLISSNSSTNKNERAITSTPSAPPNVVAVPMASCVVCSKPSRTNSVYCSDECIRKHAGMANSSVATTTPLPTTTASATQNSSSTKERQNEQISKKHEPIHLPKALITAGPIIVMERKTGRCLTGKNAPTAENLKAWLLSHPTFEIVPPGSQQAAIILEKQAKVRKQQMANEAQKKNDPANSGAKQSLTGTSQGSPKIQSQIKITDHKKLTIASPARQQHGQASKPPLKTFSKISSAESPSVKATPTVPKLSPTSLKTSPQSSASSTPNSSNINDPSSKQPKKISSDPKITPKQATPTGENIRVTVKKTLKEHLAQRTSELSDKNAVRLTDEEIEKFVAEIEEEMFTLFNKDTGAKYRAKYRSLVFNIKDRKNLSLFQKICEKRIEAKQLVRMTPEELASQELAQWRENENKHQLEMIKKSELDLLACAKNYVLKTHKGEEVIEGKRDDRLQLDPTTAVDDVVAILNNSTVSSTSEVNSTLSPSKDNYRKDYDFHGKYSTGMYGSGPITSSTVSGTSTSQTSATTTTSYSTSTSSSTAKKKESRRSRSRSRSHDRHKDRSRSRSKHKRRRSKSHDRHSSRSRDRERHHRDNKSDHHKSDHKSDHKSEHHKSEHHHKKHESRNSRDSREKSVSDRPKETETSSSVSLEKEALGKSFESGKTFKKMDSKTHALESFNLVDQILASAGSSNSSGKSDEPRETDEKAMQDEAKHLPSEQDQEPTSTVTIPTPPHSTIFDSESPTNDFASMISGDLSDEDRKKAIVVHWTGNVHMIDVASVEMSIRSVSGDIEDIIKVFPEDLNICGTIKPEMVWDYIGQIKKSVNKEVCLIRFHSNERAAYYTLYSHLFSRKRYSVVKSPSSLIKDFYIFPLPSGQMIPMILKPFRGPGIIEGDKKPDLLLGIIVKVKGKRSGNALAGVSAKNPRRQTKTTTSGSSGSATVSPSFALMQQVITKYATANKKTTITDPEKSVSSTPTSPGSTTSKVAVPAASTQQPKNRTISESSDHVDVDMDIIKAPIASKASSAKESIPAVVIDDDDEPYSPGGGSNDSDHFADVTAIVETKTPTADSEPDQIRREMEEIIRKIAEEKNEIVGLINKAELKEDEIKSTLDPSLITDIAIPSNLSEILASIKVAPPSGSEIPKEKEENTPTLGPAEDDEEEYVPTSIYSGYKSCYGYGANKSNSNSELNKSRMESNSGSGTSRLANLSEAELLSMVPDDSYLQPSTSKPKDPVVELDSDDSIPPPKKSNWDSNEPPPPGVESDLDGE